MYREVALAFRLFVVGLFVVLFLMWGIGLALGQDERGSSGYTSGPTATIWVLFIGLTKMSGEIAAGVVSIHQTQAECVRKGDDIHRLYSNGLADVKTHCHSFELKTGPDM